MTNQIQMISVDKLYPHPDNPRKDVGDVTELADSIRESGILQNLTVVPHDEGYRVIIGHRRLAASKLAGLTQLPCAVADMDYETQVATMMAENMQRVDLTVVEQAFGIQLLFDLGADMEAVKQKTGFSESTIKKRVKIATLPKKEAEAAIGRGATIEEYLKCCEIENEKDRENVLAKAGTENFNWEHTQAIRKQSIKKYYPDIIKKLLHHRMKNIGRSEKWSNDLDRVCGGYVYNEKARDELFGFEPVPKTEYVFYSDMDTGEVYIYKKVKRKKSAKPKKTAKEMEIERRNNELQSLSQMTFEMRRDFLLSFEALPEHEAVIKEQLVCMLAKKESSYHGCNEKILKLACGDDSSRSYPDKEKLTKWAKSAKNAMLIFAYYYTGDGYGCECYNKGYSDMPTHRKENSVLDRAYTFLQKLGYQISTEEQKLLDGTHELFEPYEEDEK